MRSICFFSSYFEEDMIPYYLGYYLQHIRIFFDDVYLLTNEKALSADALNFLNEQKIQLKYYKNEGMDFGMWKKAIHETDLSGYERIALVNDSCILFTSLVPYFEWLEKSQPDVAGMVRSGKFSEHLQSYFLIINKNGISHLVEYFKREIPLEYRDIIFTMEIGLSDYFKSNNLKLDAFLDYKDDKSKNPSFILAEELILKGMPLIKKKFFTRKYRLGDFLTWFRNHSEIDPQHYINLIRSLYKKEELIDLERVQRELGGPLTKMERWRFTTGQKTYDALSGNKMLHGLFHSIIKLKRSLRHER